MFSYLAAMVIAEIALERVEGAHNGADALEVSVLPYIVLRTRAQTALGLYAAADLRPLANLTVPTQVDFLLSGFPGREK